MTTHAHPPAGAAQTPCCARLPRELPIGDKLTRDRARVTCTPMSVLAATITAARRNRS